jgi:hypothetical protein
VLFGVEVGGVLSGVEVPVVLSGVVLGLASGTVPGVLHGVPSAVVVDPAAQGGCVPGVEFTLLDPLAPGVAMVPGEDV